MRHPASETFAQGPQAAAHSSKDHILDWMADGGEASLHAWGWSATTTLMRELPADCGGPVLELGCGTGETAVRIASGGRRVVAMDRSSKMLKVAGARAKWCGVEGYLAWVQAGADGVLPFADAAFGAVVVESVLAINTPGVLLATVAEIRRVVRPGGRVLINETVWRSGVSKALAEDFNRSNLSSYGIIQATVEPFDLGTWTRMFTNAGFLILRAEALDQEHSALVERATDALRRARAWTFTVSRRLRRLIRMGRNRRAAATQPASSHIGFTEPVLEGALFVLQRPFPKA